MKSVIFEWIIRFSKTFESNQSLVWVIPPQIYSLLYALVPVTRILLLLNVTFLWRNLLCCFHLPIFPLCNRVPCIALSCSFYCFSITLMLFIFIYLCLFIRLSSEFVASRLIFFCHIFGFSLSLSLYLCFHTVFWISGLERVGLAKNRLWIHNSRNFAAHSNSCRFSTGFCYFYYRVGKSGEKHRKNLFDYRRTFYFFVWWPPLSLPPHFPPFLFLASLALLSR